jgi:hypothetical protein
MPQPPDKIITERVVIMISIMIFAMSVFILIARGCDQTDQVRKYKICMEVARDTSKCDYRR